MPLLQSRIAHEGYHADQRGVFEGPQCKIASVRFAKAALDNLHGRGQVFFDGLAEGQRLAFHAIPGGSATRSCGVLAFQKESGFPYSFYSIASLPGNKTVAVMLE